MSTITPSSGASIGLELLDGEYAVCRFEPGDVSAFVANFTGIYSLTATHHETSVVCRVEQAPHEVPTECGWRELYVKGPIPFGLTGVVAWSAVETKLRQENKDGILFIDDCTRHLRTLNKLVDHLSSLERPHLRIIVTTETAKWKVSPKSRGFFTKGTLIKISVLERSDIDNLISLLDQKPEIRALVETHFLELRI